MNTFSELHVYIKAYDKAENMDMHMNFAGKVNSLLCSLTSTLLKIMQLLCSKCQKKKKKKEFWSVSPC